MNKNLNQIDPDKYKLLLDSIRMYPNQIRQAWEEINSTDVPKECFLARKVVIAGMGGSALGGRIIDSLIVERSRVPIEVFTEYHIPSYVDNNTLVIVSSYSGNTEETIIDTHQAIKKNAKIFVITTDGNLAKLKESENLSGYIFDPKFNPSKQPRLSLGYSITSILAILSRCEFISISNSEIEDTVKFLNDYIKDIDIKSKENINVAKSLAKNLMGKIPVLIASEHLVGSAHAFKNQLNETAKTFSVIFDIPELNHHLMEGLKNPKNAKQILKFLFFESDKYLPHVKKRYPITQDVVSQNNCEYLIYKLRSEKKIIQAYELLILGSFVSFYLSYLYDCDPLTIPWVDYFKEKLRNIK